MNQAERCFIGVASESSTSMHLWSRSKSEFRRVSAFFTTDRAHRGSDRRDRRASEIIPQESPRLTIGLLFDKLGGCNVFERSIIVIYYRTAL